jgi:hypothetical protein
MAKKKKKKGKAPVVPQRTLGERVFEYINPDITYVDISHCEAGAHVRMVKSAGVLQLCASIRDHGYNHVTVLISLYLLAARCSHASLDPHVPSDGLLHRVGIRHHCGDQGER